MTIDEAVRKRIRELLIEKNMNVCDLSLAGGLTPSTLYDFMRGTSVHIQCNTVKAVCMGFGVSLREFFDRDYFDDYE